MSPNWIAFDSYPSLSFLSVIYHEMGGSLVITNTGTFSVDLFFTLSAY